MLGGSPLLYKTCRQTAIALSSTEAEYYAVTELVKQLIPVRLICRELGVIGDESTAVLVDNTSTIKIAQDGGSRNRTKHIDTRAHWLQEKSERGIISIHHVSTDNQVADFFTKPLVTAKFERNRRMMMMMAVLSLCTLFTNVTAYQFVKSDPVYFSKTNINYVTGDHTFKMVLHVANPCSLYFNGTHPDPALNRQLLNMCNMWFEQDTTAAMYSCKRMDIAKSSMISYRNSNEVDNYQHQIVKRFLPLIWVGFIIISTAATYIGYQEEQNAANINILKEAADREREIMKQAIDGMIMIRDSFHSVQEGLYDLEARMGHLNQTVKSHAKSFSLLANTHFFMSNVRSELMMIDIDASNKKISPRLTKLIQQQLWREGDEQYGTLDECSHFMTEKGFYLALNFNIVQVDVSAQIKEANSLKWWNMSTSTSGCRMRYAGPRYILANKTSSCFMGVDSNWIGNKRLEGHPCNDAFTVHNDTRYALSNRVAYATETCTNNFEADVVDIQIKTNNGFHKLYCFGFYIIVHGHNMSCPDYVFDLPLTTSFSILDYDYVTESSNHVIAIDAEELQMNNQIIKQLIFEQFLMPRQNLSLLDSAIDKLEGHLAYLSNNITLVNNSTIMEAIGKPIKTVVNHARSLWSWIEQSLGFIVFLGLGFMILIAARVIIWTKSLVSLVYRILLWMINPWYNVRAMRDSTSKKHNLHKYVV